MDKKRDLFASVVIAELGGPAATARLFGIKPPSVSGWMKKGVPPARVMYLEVAYPSVVSKARAAVLKTRDVPAVDAEDDVQPPVGSREETKK